MSRALQFKSFFDTVFNANYEIKLKYNNLFNTADIQTLLRNEESVGGKAYALGVRDEALKQPVLAIFVGAGKYLAPTLAKATELVYTETKYSFRIYTQEDLDTVKDKFILGLRQSESLIFSNFEVDVAKIETSLSLEGYATLTGEIRAAGYLTSRHESRPYDNINIDTGLIDNGKK